MSCEKERREYSDAVEAHVASVQALKRQEGALFGAQSPAPILLSDQDVETFRRLEAEEQETGRIEQEKALTYERARPAHQEG